MAAVTSHSPPVEPDTVMEVLQDRLHVARHRVRAVRAGAPEDDAAVRDAVAALDEALRVVEGQEPYLSRCTTAESPDQRRLAERTIDEDWSRHDAQGGGRHSRAMLSGHVEGQFLKFLVRATGARRALDLGLFSGYSALAMAEAVPSDGRVVACEVNPAVAATARDFLTATACGGRVDIRVGPAADTLRELAATGEVFDLVFLDADKVGYVEYLRLLLDGGLLAATGVVCVDNTLYKAESYSDSPSANGAAIAAFNQAVADDPRLDHVMIPLRDGVTLIRLRDGSQED